MNDAANIARHIVAVPNRAADVGAMLMRTEPSPDADDVERMLIQGTLEMAAQLQSVSVETLMVR